MSPFYELAKVCEPQTPCYSTLSSSGTKDVEIGVDDDGFIFLGYDANMDDEAEFHWRKNYTEPIDAGRAWQEKKKEG